MHKVCLYISPEPEQNGRDFESEKESSEPPETAVPWWMKNRSCNKVIYYKRHNRAQARRDEEIVLNIKNSGIIDDPERTKSANGFKEESMCDGEDARQPILVAGALSLRDSRKSMNLGKEARRSITGTPKSNPDDAEFNQNGKIEILQDLDLYYIRQIAHNLKEYDLEQKIDLEIKMREGTTKLLAACKHRSQSLEAAKNLLTSNERMSAYMSELQRRKKEAPCRGLGYPKISKARLSLSDLRMPLIWRDTDHFKNKGDYRRFAVFCLARVGTEIYDTSLLSPVDRSLTDLTFPDVMLFSNVAPDFELRLEVYSHILQDDLTMASTSRKIKKTIHSSISRTVGKKLAATLNDELNAGKIGPRFELTATARLTLEEVHDGIRTHDLQIQTTDTRSHQLPLFGHFCCRLAAQPNSFTQEACSGDVSIRFHDENEERTWESAWARLQSFNVDLWNQRKYFEADQPPFRSVPVNKNVTIKTGKHSTEIVVSVNNNQKPVATMRLKTVEEQQKWLKSLNQQAEDHRRWRNAAESCLNVMSPGSVRNSFKGFRQGSLYDQTPIIETVAPEVPSHRRTVQEIFGLTPSTSLSSCASSSSSSTFRDRSNSSSRRTNGTKTIRPPGRLSTTPASLPG